MKNIETKENNYEEFVAYYFNEEFLNSLRVAILPGFSKRDEKIEFEGIYKFTEYLKKNNLRLDINYIRDESDNIFGELTFSLAKIIRFIIKNGYKGIFFKYSDEWDEEDPIFTQYFFCVKNGEILEESLEIDEDSSEKIELDILINIESWNNGTIDCIASVICFYKDFYEKTRLGNFLKVKREIELLNIEINKNTEISSIYDNLCVDKADQLQRSIDKIKNDFDNRWKLLWIVIITSAIINYLGKLF